MRARAALLVLGVALATSATSLGNGFAYDDVHVVQEDERIRSLERPGDLLLLAYWPEEMHDRIYRPATTLSFAVDWAVGGGSPLVFHVVNVGLHLAVTLLVMLLAWRIAPTGAVVAGLVFAVHPVHVEAVASIVGRSELLAAVGYLAAALLYLASGDAARNTKGPARRAVLAAGTMTAALVAYASKEHALTLPAALMLCDAWASSRDGERVVVRIGRNLPLLAGTVALGIAYLAVRWGVLGTVFGGGATAPGLEGLDLPERAVAMLPVVLLWARLLLFPLRLSADYAPDHLVVGLDLGLGHAAGLITVAGAVWAGWLVRRKAPAVTFGLAWFAVTIAVSSNVLFPTPIITSERALYLPSAGIALALGGLWAATPRLRVSWHAVAAVLALLSLRSIERAGVWRDNDRFFAAMEKDAPDSYRTRWQLGSRAFKRGDRAVGDREFRSAITIYQGDASLVAELGSFYLEAGRFDAADRLLTAALGLDSMMSDVVLRAIAARMLAGRPDSAAALALSAVRRFPAHEGVLAAGVSAMREAGRPRHTLGIARLLAYAGPGRWQWHLVAAEAALDAGECEEASRRLERAEALAPGEPETRNLRGAVRSGCLVR